MLASSERKEDNMAYMEVALADVHTSLVLSTFRGHSTMGMSRNPLVTISTARPRSCRFLRFSSDGTAPSPASFWAGRKYR